MAARFGGEEFVVILTQYSADGGQQFPWRLCEEVPQMVIAQVSWLITGSFGVAQRQQGESLDDFINRGDEAMYRAKRNGRNWVEI